MPNTTDMQIPSNRVRDIERYIHEQLTSQYPDGEIRAFIRMLFEEYLGWDTAQLLLHHDDTVNQSDLLKFHWAAAALKQNRPIQHIIGHTTFCDCHITVTPDVLIPRPETEEMVTTALRLLSPERHPRRIVDLCTGSGCIAIALSKNIPTANVFAIDISQNALTIAQKNAQQNGVSINFIQTDILRQGTGLPNGPFDLIISNPPYIADWERTGMGHNVLDHEPHIALFVPDDAPLCFYKAIGDYAMHNLSPAGVLMLEINERLGQETCETLQSKDLAVQLLQDFNGKDRFIVATLKKS